MIQIYDTTLRDGTQREGISLSCDDKLRIARRLRFPWPLLYVGILLPRALRDAIYRWIARNRYRWFGQKESCGMPPPGLRERFIAWE